MRRSLEYSPGHHNGFLNKNTHYHIHISSCLLIRDSGAGIVLYPSHTNALIVRPALQGRRYDPKFIGRENETHKGTVPKLVSDSAGIHTSSSVCLSSACSCQSSWFSLGRERRRPQPPDTCWPSLPHGAWHRHHHFPRPLHLLPPLWQPQGLRVSICFCTPAGAVASLG